MGTMPHQSQMKNDAVIVGCYIAEDETEYAVLPSRQEAQFRSHEAPGQHKSTDCGLSAFTTSNQADNDVLKGATDGAAKEALEGALSLARDGAAEQADAQASDEAKVRAANSTVGEFAASRINDAEKLRLAMALVQGLTSATDDRTADTAFLRNRLASAVGQEAPSQCAEKLRSRLKSLARATDRNLAEQLKLLVLFDDRQLYALEGCRSMLVWMDIHLRLGRIAASERLRVGRALSDLPMLSSLFALGHVSFSQLREVTRYANAGTDAEFAIAVLELSVSETIEYCRRFRHLSDANEDAANIDVAGQEEADARAAMRAYQRRSLSIREIDPHSTRVTLELPNDLAAEFLRSLEQVEDWIREGGEVSSTSPTLATAPTATQRRADAAVLMSRRSLTLAGEAVAMADRYRVHVSVSAGQLVQGQEGIYDFEFPTMSTAAKPIERAQLRGHGPIPNAVAKRLAAVAGFTMLATDDQGDIVGTRKRATPFSKSQLRTLTARDQCCQVPGCGATRHLHGHHVVHRENGGRSDLSNAVLVCSSCHRLLHEGGFQLERIGPNGAEPGPYASGLGTMCNSKARAQARAKIGKIRHYRLFGPDGREHGSLSASRESEGRRVMLVPKCQKEQVQEESAREQPTGPATIQVFPRGNTQSIAGSAMSANEQAT